MEKQQVEVLLRPALEDDAQGISNVLMALKAAGKRRTAGNAEEILSHYITHPDRIQCTVAEVDGQVIGFQSLRLATEGNPYGTPVGWGIIGTHIHPSAARCGVGKRLAGQTIKVALVAGLRHVEARIGTENAAGLAYYGSIGFVSSDEAGVKVLNLPEV